MAFKLRTPPKLTAKMSAFQYQLDAVRAIQDLPYAAIFHEQGLGKTKIAIDLALHWVVKDIVDTVFIITKKMLVQNWMYELAQHSYLSPRILSGNQRANNIALNSPVLMYVMNYEIVSTNFDLLLSFLKTCRVGVFLDESQKIKNPEAKLTQYFHKLADGFCRRVIMTGTPAANRPYDIWSQIKFLDGGESLGDSYADFKSKTDLPDKDAQGNYGKELAGIMGRIASFTVRETKKTSGLQLPDKTIITHYVQLEPVQKQIYADYRNELQHELQNLVIDNADDILKRLLRLVQCASNPILIDELYDEVPGKFIKLLQILEDIVDDSTNVIIWSGFIKNVQWLHKQLYSYGPTMVHGSLSIEQRNLAIEKFKMDQSCRILVATPGSAKEGLTLTNANHAIFYDRSFSLDDYLQAQDRIHRISQEQECFVHNLIAEATIDEWVDSLLDAKYRAAQLAQGDISESEFSSSFNFELSEILSIVLGDERTHRGLENE